MPFDRVKYLRKIRRKMLKKLGLPPDTPPEEIQAMLENRRAGGEPDLSSEKGRVEYLRQVRQQLLHNLGLPQDTPPEKVAELLAKKK